MDKEYYYLINDSIITLSDELTIENGFELGTTYEDSLQGVWTPLTEDQIVFYLKNPSASSHEIFNAELDIVPEPTPIPELELLDRAKQRKIQEIQKQDRSTEVFVVNGTMMWLDKNTRASLVSNTIPAEKAVGKTNMTLWYDGQPPVEITVPIEWLETALLELERYAKNTYDITQKHIQTVYSFTTVEDIESYDVTSNYPMKIVFELN